MTAVSEVDVDQPDTIIELGDEVILTEDDHRKADEMNDEDAWPDLRGGRDIDPTVGNPWRPE